MFAMFASDSRLLVGLAFLVGNPLIQASMYGPMGAYLGELFDTPSRYSGVSATYQLGSLLGAGLAPLVAARLVTGSGSTTSLAWYIVAMYVVSALGVALSRPTTSASSRHAEGPVETKRA